MRIIVYVTALNHTTTFSFALLQVGLYACSNIVHAGTMIDFFSHVLLLCFFIGLQQGRLHGECWYVERNVAINYCISLLFTALESCEPEGSIQLAVNDTQEYIDSNNQTYHLLQVCLFGHWSYVCSNGFGHASSSTDRNVALFQLGCVSGGVVC